MSNTNVFAGLEPRGFWTHFEAITKIPRPSGQEEKMVEYIRSWATARGYQALQDAVGNLCGFPAGRRSRRPLPSCCKAIWTWFANATPAAPMTRPRATST